MEKVTTNQTWKLISPYGIMLIKDGVSLKAAKELLVIAESQFNPENESSETENNLDSRVWCIKNTDHGLWCGM